MRKIWNLIVGALKRYPNTAVPLDITHLRGSSLYVPCVDQFRDVEEATIVVFKELDDVRGRPSLYFRCNLCGLPHLGVLAAMR